MRVHLIMVVLVGTLACDACAFGRKSPNISVGPSISYSSGREITDGPTYGLDISYIDENKKLKIPLWLSVGMRVTDNDQGTIAIPYGEFGTWALFSLGLGYSHYFIDNHADYSGINAFVGFPVILYGINRPKKPGFYIEPYYRPIYFLDGAENQWSHEIGIMIKYTTLKIGSWNPKYDK